MTAIITSDLHLTEHPRDDYRWALWPWLRRELRSRKTDTLIICGDLTDAKDRHPSTLVNRFVGELYETSKVAEIVLIRANHDCIDEDHPFFEFTNLLGEKLFFVNSPSEFEVDGLPCLAVPNRRDPAFWQELDKRPYKFIFAHETFDGSESENGTELKGIPTSIFADFKGVVISGDIHVPQKVAKNILHVGAPYRVRFGDKYKPRLLMLDHGKLSDLNFPGISREVVDISSPRELDKIKFPKGTQVKIKVHLKRQQFGDKADIRQTVQNWAAKNQFELCSMEWKLIQVRKIAADDDDDLLTPAEIVRGYAKSKKLSNPSLALGLSFVKELE